MGRVRSPLLCCEKNISVRILSTIDCKLQFKGILLAVKPTRKTYRTGLALNDQNEPVLQSSVSWPRILVPPPVCTAYCADALHEPNNISIYIYFSALPTTHRAPRTLTLLAAPPHWRRAARGRESYPSRSSRSCAHRSVIGLHVGFALRLVAAF